VIRFQHSHALAAVTFANEAVVVLSLVRELTSLAEGKR
jgi:hypothetical protein